MNGEHEPMVCDEIRTLPQNARFHAMVDDIARQLDWAGEKLDPEDWKRLLLAGKYGQRTVPNPINGIGFVVMNSRRSRALTIEEMSDFLMEIQVFGDERGIKWSRE